MPLSGGRGGGATEELEAAGAVVSGAREEGGEAGDLAGEGV